MVLLFDIFFKNWNRIAIIKIIKDEIKAKKNELNDKVDNSLRSTEANVSMVFLRI